MLTKNSFEVALLRHCFYMGLPAILTPLIANSSFSLGLKFMSFMLLPSYSFDESVQEENLIALLISFI